ncbi:hypothetical protein HYDPIDRAFT_105145 [Hydnomerulius pinastri MD-312]|nr:hypothetical protein HYDPIDRAFT_105145 [Hydnomerulius pinastri MD-312]
MSDDLPPLPTFARRKMSRVQGPRPCSWIHSSSAAEDQDLWSWPYRQADLSRGSTTCSRSSSESSHSSATSSSFSSSSIEYTPNIASDYGAQSQPRPHRSHRRKPLGPRPPHDVPHFDKRPALAISTSIPLEIPVLPQPQDTVPHAASLEHAPTLPAPKIHSLIASSPTNYLLDWDAIFEVLGCSRA